MVLQGNRLEEELLGEPQELVHRLLHFEVVKPRKFEVNFGCFLENERCFLWTWGPDEAPLLSPICFASRVDL
jgi:hypothetical protein